MFLALIDNSVRMLTYAALLLCCFYVESRRVLAKVENMRLTHFLRHSKSWDEKRCKCLKMVGPEGLEPSTNGL